MSGEEVFTNKTVKDLLREYRVIWALGHAQSLLSWDSETYMPPEGVSERAIAMAELSVLSRKLYLRPDFVKLVERASAIEDLNDYERGVVRVLTRTIERLTKIPEELVYERAKTSQEATHAWRKAKEKSDYSIFKPYLERIIDINRRIAEHLGYEEHPYDALLDLYEEGLKTRDVDRIFEGLIPGLKKILEETLSAGYYPQHHDLEKVEYRKEDLEAVNREILDILGYPWSRGRLDESPHPFTNGIGVKDVRITTRYEGVDPKRTIYAVIHEFGHALYELQVDERLMYTPIAGGASLGIHESQSRFWENIVGRSPWFTAKVREVLGKRLDIVKRYSSEEFYRYVNTVRPSLIRVDADELTYNFHIYLRFKLEKLMISGEIGAEDLPELWNSLMEELLGVKPRRDSEGVLQDIHWSGGMIGYFPTYTIGTIVSAKLWQAVEEEVGSLGDVIEGDRLGDLRAYLREKIHRWGSTYPPKELLQRSLSWSLEPEPLLRYLEWKYLRA
ncbi:MAG: carboxypeptidase M32 [Desulfurococcales archaeon]|nr:carboxypeptidase M32 [Desulfurococcales archaeon]